MLVISYIQNIYLQNAIKNYASVLHRVTNAAIDQNNQQLKGQRSRP